MSNAVIGFPRSTNKFTLTGGSWQSAYSLLNLQELPLSMVARSTDLLTSSTVIIATSIGRPRVGVLALAGHNGSLSAQIRVRMWADIGHITLLYDSGYYDMWPTIYPYSGLEWESDSYWTGKYTLDEIEGTSWTWFWHTGVEYLPAIVQLDISDPGNTDGFFQAGFFELAGRAVLSRNFSPGSQYGYRWRTTSTEALGGAQYNDVRPKPKVFKGIIKYATRDEALASHFERNRQLDIDQPMIWLPNPSDVTQWPREAMLAQQRDPGLFTRSVYNADEVPIYLEEIIG